MTDEEQIRRSDDLEEAIRSVENTVDAKRLVYLEALNNGYSYREARLMEAKKGLEMIGEAYRAKVEETARNLPYQVPVVQSSSDGGCSVVGVADISHEGNQVTATFTLNPGALSKKLKGVIGPFSIGMKVEPDPESDLGKHCQSPQCPYPHAHTYNWCGYKPSRS